MSFSPSKLDTLCINTIRTLSIDAVQKANSGHPGLPLGAAPMAYVLWQYFLKHNPKDPNWQDRDRFVLSAGHGSMLLYSLLHLTGYNLSLDEIKKFRQWGSKTPGHPEFGLTSGVEATTGPLGQGTANAVGMAIAERFLAHHFNREGFEIVNHYTYALVSDGDLQEGISAEAASLAGHLKLGKLIYLYDSNDVTLDGPASLAWSESVARRYESYGWQVLEVKDGDNDLRALYAAIEKAKAETTKPSLVIVKTTIGFGSPNKQGKSSSHGSPLGAEEVKLTKKTLGWTFDQDFYIPEEARKNFLLPTEQHVQTQKKWNDLFASYQKKYPELAAAWKLAQSGETDASFYQSLSQFKAGDQQATRVSSGEILNQLAKNIPWMIGGDADLSCSTNTLLKDQGSFEGQKGSGRNIHYGVREHAMGAIANGMAYHGGVKTFTATFFCFADYMRPAVRLAALNHLPVVFIWTHDSIALGEDGPTHQPVEHLMSLRAIPGLTVFRPCDANETREALKYSIENKKGPTAIVLTRQKVPVLDRVRYAPAEHAQKGAYILSVAKEAHPQVVIYATGSEVSLALSVQELLEKGGLSVQVVSMPSWEVFSRQDATYQDLVLGPKDALKVSIEAGVTLGWQKWVGTQGITIGIDRFGASAPDQVLLKEYGFTPDQIVQKIRDHFTAV